MFSHTYIVPDYYKNFVCKGGGCRKTCCKGWGVSLSMREYFRLLGLNCPQKLRKTLDCAFYPAQPQSTERYVLFRKDDNGDCPLHAKNGLCSLHKSCGENILPSVCRYYPRAPKSFFAYECCCSNSCEKVIEILVSRQDKITFEPLTLTFDLDSDSALAKDEALLQNYQSVRNACFGLLQDRTYSLPSRLANICKFVSSPPDYNTSQGIVCGSLDCSPNTLQPLAITKAVALWFEQNNPSLSEYATTVEQTFSTQEEAYFKAQQQFEQLFPQWQVMFENILMNHLFYDRFPFVDKGNPKAAYLSLCGVYAFLRYMAIGYTYTNTSLDSFVDVVAAAFRVVEHSNFAKNIAIMLKKEGVDTLEKAVSLLSI